MRRGWSMGLAGTDVRLAVVLNGTTEAGYLTAPKSGCACAYDRPRPIARAPRGLGPVRRQNRARRSGNHAD
jgi:hypothetical protein